MAFLEVTASVQVTGYRGGFHLQGEWIVWAVFTCRSEREPPTCKCLCSCANISRLYLSKPASSNVFTVSFVPNLDPSPWATTLTLNYSNRLVEDPADRSVCGDNLLLQLLQVALVFLLWPPAEMQRFGFYMSSGSLIGLQDIYRFYTPDPVEDSECPPYFSTPNTNTEASPDNPGGGEVDKTHLQANWTMHPEPRKLPWMSEPDLFSRHPSVTNPDAVLESKESYHSLASLVSWQRILSDMTVVSSYLSFRACLCCFRQKYHSVSTPLSPPVLKKWWIHWARNRSSIS